MKRIFGQNNKKKEVKLMQHEQYGQLERQKKKPPVEDNWGNVVNGINITGVVQ